MKQSIGFIAFASLFAFGIAHAQSAASQAGASLTPLQKEMLKSPGAHLCGNAVTNVSCDELNRAQENNYQPAPTVQIDVANAPRWTVLTAGTAYAVRQIESRPFILLIATRGATLSEPLALGFYIPSSKICAALANPVNGPFTGDIGDGAGLVQIDGKDYALDGTCDGGNLLLLPSYWVTRKALFDSVKNDSILAVRFKPGPTLHYRTDGFSSILKDLDVNAPYGSPQ